MKLEFIIIMVLTIILLFILLKYYWLKRKYIGLYTIETMSSSFSQTLHIKELLKSIIECTQDMLKAEACSLYLIDHSTQELYFEVALGKKGHLLKEIRLKIGEGIAGTVAKTGEPLNIPDISKDMRFNRNREIAKSINFKEKAILTVPIKSNNELLGVIQFINKKNGLFFTEKDEETVHLLIQLQIASNLEKALLYEQLNQTFVDSIETLVSTIEARDSNTQGHSKRVAALATTTGRYIGLNPKDIECLRYAGILHDVGKIGIRDAILNKQSSLSAEEYNIMKTHPLLGDTILANISSLDPRIREAAKSHHERYDGKGYPQGLIGEEIPVFARILALVDTYDAMTSDRVYRKGLPIDIALTEIEKGMGSQFDPVIAAQFIEMMREH